MILYAAMFDFDIKFCQTVEKFFVCSKEDKRPCHGAYETAADAIEYGCKYVEMGFKL